MAKKKKKTNLTKSKTTVKKPSSSRSKISLIVPVSAFILVLTILFLSYFSLTRASLAPVFVGTTSIDSTASKAALEKKIALSSVSYGLTLRYPDKSQKVFTLSEAGMTIDSKQSAKEIKEYLQNNLWERLAWWQPIQLELAVITDKNKLAEFVASKATVVVEAPQDAVLSTPDGVATLTPEKPGTGYRVEHAKITLTNAAATQNPKPLVLKSSVLEPSITAKNLKGSKQRLENILSRNITFSIAGRTITPSPAAIADWIELSPVPTSKTIDVTVNSGRIVAYIDTIAESYVYLPRNKLVMNMPSGPLVLDYGADGTDISNKDEAAAIAAKQLLKENEINIVLLIKHAEAKLVELQPYDRFIVVDTGAKRMYAYEKTQLVRTVPISAGAPNTPTVLGQYKIYSKRVSQDMRGANVDGSRYFQAAVPYVNYFYGSYAIHGNYWRPDSWFGNVNSSHGCVGINEPDDAWIYHWAPVGTPVIVHD